MTPDARLEADLRALGAAVRPSAGFAERVAAGVAAAPRPRRRRRLAPLLVAAGLMLATTGVYLATRPRPAPDPDPAPAVEFVEAADPSKPADAPPLPTVAFSRSAFAYQNSRWGFIDRTGAVVVPARYSRVDAFADGLAPVKVGGTHAAGGKWGFIDRTGREVVPPRYDWARPFREGLAAVKAGEKWGFIDRTGRDVVPPRFESVESFSGGLAAMQENGLWGFIGPDGAFRIPPQFASAHSFSEGLAAVRDPLPPGAPEGARMPLKYIDRTGAVAFTLPPEIDYAGWFQEERAGVTRDGLWGVIDRAGRVVVEPRYSAFEGFEGGRARVSVRRSIKVNGFAKSAGTKSGYIAADGTELGPFFDDYDNGVEIDPKTGALSAIELDAALEEVRVTKIDFDRLRHQGGLYRVSAPLRAAGVSTHTVGFVDRQGRVVIPPSLEDVGDFREGLAPFATGLDWAAVGAAARQGR